MIRFFNNFTKVTAWPVYMLLFRPRIRYENRAVQGRRIKGPAIIISNHTSVYDYAVMLFTFGSRTLRVQMADVLFRKPLLGWYLRRMGGIIVDRDNHDFGFLQKSADILGRGGVVGIYPESRLPKPGEERPLPFKPSAAYLALTTGVPVIPMYTDGSYFRRRGARVVVGTPVNVFDVVDNSLTERENVERAAAYMRERVISLGKELENYE